MTFEQFFKTATGHAPYDYQRRLAGGDTGKPCASQLINVPTGLGKTAAVVLAWLWNRVAPTLNSQPRSLNSNEWPRRLVYCLPMRTLVEQTRDNVAQWLKSLVAKAPELGITGGALEELTWLAAHSPVILMGGEEPKEAQREWDLYPEHSCILIGTQDMLLSRALNRGYSMYRSRWPMHFGLLNNDALWVMDETQLMGVGVETSAQLNGFRSDGKMPTVNPCPTWWMSATLDDARLVTVDHREISATMPTEELSKEEQEGPDSRPKALFEAKKSVSKCALTLSTALKRDDYAGQFAALIVERHAAILGKPHGQGTLTLVVVNRVSRAREVFQALTNAAKKGSEPMFDPARVALIHSRFRPSDRAKHGALLLGEGDRIVIATQAVEAGVDVSARLLITELAPWSSLVQRMGCCNRRAEFSDAEVLWMDIEPDIQGELLLPYKEDELKKARTALKPLTDASPLALRDATVEPEEKIIRPVIRRRDLVDLFDTTPGWTGDAKDKPTPCPPPDGALERYAGNRLSLDRDWQTIAAHSALVVAETSLITTALGLTAGDAATLRTAALWHDVGKAHDHFQKMLRDGPHPPDDAAALYAKSKNPPKPSRAAKDYRSLRHELASALAWLLAGPPDASERDLTAYLIAAHHGKVRLSIRSLPNESAPDDDRLFARGIWHGDKLPAAPLGEITTPAVTLDLSFMQMGEGPRGESKEVSPSWLARAIALRDRLGPFRLAFLETVLRAADARASAGANSPALANAIPTKP